MSWHTRSHVQQEKILQASALYCQGKTQSAIGRELGLNQATVCKYLKILEQHWLESSLINFDEARARELARIDNLEREYWEAWLRSIGLVKTTTHERRTSDEGDAYSKVSVRKENQVGDPRYLEGVRWCIEQRGKLLGLYAPIKQDVVIHDFSKWTLEELEAEVLREAERITGGDRAQEAGPSGGAGT